MKHSFDFRDARKAYKRDPTRENLEKQVHDLLALMTLREKSRMLTGRLWRSAVA